MVSWSCKWSRHRLYDKRGCGSYLKRRLLLALLRNKISWFYISFLIAVSFFESLRLPLAKGSSTFSPSPSSSGSRDVTALWSSEPLRFMVGGASKPSPCYAGWDRLTIARWLEPPCYSLLIGAAWLQFAIAWWLGVHGGRIADWDYHFCSSLQYRSALVATRMRNIIFILLLTELPLGRCPSGLWRKSYDRQWLYVPKWNKRAMLYLLKPSARLAWSS